MKSYEEYVLWQSQAEAKDAPWMMENRIPTPEGRLFLDLVKALANLEGMPIDQVTKEARILTKQAFLTLEEEGWLPRLEQDEYGDWVLSGVR